MSSRHAAIVLAAGSGTRMHSDIPKQYLDLRGKPVLYYSLKALEESFVDDIVLVTGVGWQEYCQNEIVKKYGLKKVRSIVPGGAQRYDSVYRGLRETEGADYIYIHDGARPLVSPEVLDAVIRRAEQCGAAAPAVPLKDTIKVARDGLVEHTPDRSILYAVQTPQVFQRDLIRTALVKALEEGAELTDDCSAVERLGIGVALTQGDYRNLKLTTPEDLAVAEALLTWREHP